MRLLNLIIFIRLLKILSDLIEFTMFKSILEAMKKMFVPLSYQMGILISIYYTFAIIGMYMFGGKIRHNLPDVNSGSGIPDRWYLNSFNDLLSAFVTLFSLMVINNWMVTVQMYVDVCQSEYVRIYFICFYYLTVIIALNVVVAFTLDMYSSVEKFINEKEETMDLIKESLEKENVKFS